MLSHLDYYGHQIAPIKKVGHLNVDREMEVSWAEGGRRVGVAWIYSVVTGDFSKFPKKQYCSNRERGSVKNEGPRY